MGRDGIDGDDHSYNGDPDYNIDTNRSDSMAHDIDLEEFIKSLEWVSDPAWTQHKFCPVCYRRPDNGHKEGCNMDILVKSF